ncbi:MAG: error-prone DNA polymerase [Deltaproteobacteria bacterium]|nr:error-prone DNA polymerase [Deltaproteobacteria bacterium]
MQNDYIELRARSAFCFLEGASLPEALAERAAAHDYPALALADRDGVYASPRFHRACAATGVRAIHGAEIRLRDPGHSIEGNTLSRGSSGGTSGELLLLVESPKGWRNLSRLLTLGQRRNRLHQDQDQDQEHQHQEHQEHQYQEHRERQNKQSRARPKAAPFLSFEELEEHAGGLTALARGDATLSAAFLDRSRAIFAAGTRHRGEQARLWVDISRYLDRDHERAVRRATAIAESQGVPIVASGDVRTARAEERNLLDALTCLYAGTTLDRAGRRLLPNGERHLKPRHEMATRFADRPEWIRATRAIAERCCFGMEMLEYHFPEYPLEAGESQDAALRRLSYAGARSRYGSPLPRAVRKQLEHELTIIAKLGLAGYFLIVHDISCFARSQDILVQGRGSAANSAVCYSLAITAVDPVGMKLLFERFLSEERGEWPDIDLDLPSGEKRETVIQYVFNKYGERGAAMTANVITYRTRLAVREMGKVLGMGPDSIGRLAKLIASIDHRDEHDQLETTLTQAGVDPTAPRIQKLLGLVEQIRGLPRHLGQHSGGVVIAAGYLDEVVPIEPASMENRRVVQWDKDDCAEMGIIKIDLLGLGMLAALEVTTDLIRTQEGIEIDLAKLPEDDPATYAMMRAADTIGVFQIESRAQMATLPRLKPTCFYDLVVEIALIRPGPIVGQMVHPYLERRAGRQPVTYPHPSLEPVLERTLGVPLFQEQILRIAMIAAGFSGGEAEELRRAMGFKRSEEKMDHIEARLRSGMAERGVRAKAQDEIVQYISSFALYGFPESHSASFALIAYASAYLKRHHPAAFLAGLLNSYPLGFYNPATLVKDAQRHGVGVRPVDATTSDWLCTLESGDISESGAEHPGPAVRIGLRYVGGLSQKAAEQLVFERARAPFHGMPDLTRRVTLKQDEITALAELGALANLPGAPGAEQRRAALWQVAALERDPRSLFAGLPPDARGQRAHGRKRTAAPSPLPEMSPIERTLADYRLSGLTTGPQILAYLREGLRRRGVLSAKELRSVKDGRFVRTAGHVIVRQHPGTAKGFTFLTLEDETGTSNAILTPDMFRRFRVPLSTSAIIEIAGPLQNAQGVIHVKVGHVAALTSKAAHQTQSKSALRRGQLPPGRHFR